MFCFAVRGLVLSLAFFEGRGALKGVLRGQESVAKRSKIFAFLGTLGSNQEAKKLSLISISHAYDMSHVLCLKYAYVGRKLGNSYMLVSLCGGEGGVQLALDRNKIFLIPPEGEYSGQKNYRTFGLNRTIPNIPP